MIRVQFLFLLLPFFSHAQDREVWIDLPIDQWPQIALTNHVQFKNGDRYIDPSFQYAGTGFLIDTGKDTLAATAKHVLWIARNAASQKVEINEQLQSWMMRPKKDTITFVLIDQLINEDSTEILQGPSSSITDRDWLIFSLKKNTSGIFPLKPRYTRLQPGEKVYIISCAYDTEQCAGYEANLLRKKGMDLLLERKDSKNMPGASGSPVVDANGYLIGILSSASMDPTTGKSITVAVSTEYLIQVLEGKSDYNTPKKDYGELIIKTVLEKSAKKAVKTYRNLIKDPRNYYIYNLRSSNQNGLREAGEKLIDLNRIDDAIKILKLNAKVNSSFFANHNLLAKAYVLSGKLNKAIKSFRTSIKRYDDRDRNMAYEELAKLGVK